MTAPPAGRPGPTLLVVNCNTTRAMTEAIAAVAAGAASPGTTVVGLTPSWGPASAEGYFESYVTALAVLDAVLAHPDPYDAVIMAGYGEHGREGMRQAIDVPVVDITEASAFLACLVAHRFGVVTTVATAVPGIEDSLRNAGVLERCAGVAAADVAVLDIGDVAGTARALESAGARLVAAGADALVLGCAGFAGLDVALERRLGVPVLDSVTSAVRLAESLVALGKTTSTAGPYRRPDPAKAWVGPRPGAGG
ncbi:aspartate/glutamate racemase family protein [Promicromonospora sp. NPDC060204]|uniref:aspartate/glutamate racemase family protein n=1 Tax=Promicromonospora sp. NPDC060204 TaxID=3347071 RepID=UPI0036625B99